MIVFRNALANLLFRARSQKNLLHIFFILERKIIKIKLEIIKALAKESMKLWNKLLNIPQWLDTYLCFYVCVSMYVYSRLCMCVCVCEISSQTSRTNKQAAAIQPTNQCVFMFLCADHFILGQATHQYSSVDASFLCSNR